MHAPVFSSKQRFNCLLTFIVSLAVWGLSCIWSINIAQAEENNLGGLTLCPLPGEGDTLRQIGAASIEITPQQPILLSGYAARNHQLQLNIKHSLWAHALVVSDEASPPAILLTVDNVGVPASIRQVVTNRLEKQYSIAPQRVTICSTHTHGGPMLTGVLENLLTREMTPGERAAVDGYTNALVEKLVEVAAKALQQRQPGYLLRGNGKVDFAINRRGEMVTDHSLPLLVAVDKQGKPFALVANYACHCVSASSGMLLTGDWAGCAVAELRQQLPGVVGIVTIGCGGDQNPADKGGVAASERQGKQLADEVIRVLQTNLKPVNGPLRIDYQEIELPLAELPTEKQWQELATSKGIEGYHAQANLKRLERGETLTDRVTYPIQTWQFGNDLAMVFLSDEVVVDYALLIKGKHGDQTWVSGYSNDVSCYIPSERVLRRGGYEGRTSMLWYDKPSPFAAGLEKKILDEVDRQLTPEPKSSGDHTRTGGVAPRSPQESIRTMLLDDRFRVEVVAAEPLVVDPVAIDFGPDGKLWVVEMNDYPLGVEGMPAGGGRVKFLEDSNHDGHYDQATLFLEGLPYPTGVKAWGNGVLICSAPDVIYAEDTNGDGHADVRRVVLRGFATHNYQARVNSLSLGLDSWWYGAGGIFGGKLQSESMADVDAENRDFRFQPETGAVEAVSGRTQQGRARDDWGNWFGCTNSNLLYHYPSVQHYYERNPLASSPNPIRSLSSGERLFPVGELVRFSQSGAKGAPTSVCGLEIYRDELLGQAFSNNAFVCEPVNQLVHRRELVLSDSNITSRRAPEEQQREFLASTDNWFRPVQVRTAPDGSLWVVDMYRYVIEHPKFISDQVKEKLDVRAGDDRGRIYRIIPADQSSATLPNLRELSTSELTNQLDTVNGTLRDMVHAELLFRRDTASLPLLKKLAVEAALPQVRLQAFCALAGLGGIDDNMLAQVSHDPHFAVRRWAVLIAEQRLAEDPQGEKWILQALADPATEVRIQAAYSLGECHSESAATLLAQHLFAASTDTTVRAALRASLHAGNAQTVLEALNALPADHQKNYRDCLIAVAQVGEPAIAEKALALSAEDADSFNTTARIVEVLAKRQLPLEKLAALPGFADQMQAIALNDSASVEQRTAAIELLATILADSKTTSLLLELLTPRQPPEVQAKALTMIFKTRSVAGQQAILDQLSSLSPVLQTAAIGEYLARPESTLILLAGLESGQVPRAMIDLADRQKLFDHPSPEIHKRATQYFASSSQGSLQKKIEQFRRADLTGGDSVAGRALFQQQCAACHRYDDLGSVVGPDLQALTDRTKDFMVTAILDPNAAVDRRYATYSVLLNDGRVLGGILAEESNQAITLKEKEGVERRILRSDIEMIKGTGKSLMPEGLEQVISREGMQDLLAFLKAVELQAAAPKSQSTIPN